MEVQLHQHLTQLFLALFSVGVSILLLFVFTLRISKKEKKSDELKINANEQKNLLRLFGYNTNSIYHLYGRFEYFMPKLTYKAKLSKISALGYVKKGRTNILLSDPLCPIDLMEDSLKSFKEFSDRKHRDTLLFAINKNTAEKAQNLGFKLLKIGQEPIFDLKSYETQALPQKLRSAIRQVAKKGVVIEECDLSQLDDPKLIHSLNEILHHWFMSRSSEAYDLLTEVNPLAASENKKFFIARHGDHVEAFLACSPIYARKGFFLHDLIRSPMSLNGVADALIATALETLKKQGYEMASLGISPLAGLNVPGTNSEFPTLQKLLSYTYENIRFLYHFKDLYHFKKKFQPTSEEPAYLAIPQGGFKLRYLFAIISLFSGNNFFKEIIFKIKQWREGYAIPSPLAWAIDPKKIVLPPLVDLGFDTLMTRLKFTLSILFLNIYTYIFTIDPTGNVRNGILKRYGFSYQNFVENTWLVLFTSNFVHFNLQHLCLNMCGLILFCGSLEILGGSFVAALVYLVGMQANLPTGIILLPVLKVLAPGILHQTLSFLDVGASLGVMSTFGALIYLFKKSLRIPLLVVTCLFFVIFSIYERELIGVDHAFATLCGLILCHLYVNFNVSQKQFEKIDPKYFTYKPKKVAEVSNLRALSERR